MMYTKKPAASPRIEHNASTIPEVKPFAVHLLYDFRNMSSLSSDVSTRICHVRFTRFNSFDVFQMQPVGRTDSQNPGSLGWPEEQSCGFRSFCELYKARWHRGTGARHPWLTHLHGFDESVHNKHQ